MFHQHFNTGPTRARYLACSLGSRRYPFISLRKKSGEGQGTVSVQKGGRQIEYEDQDPRIEALYREEVVRAKNAGVSCGSSRACARSSRRNIRAFPMPSTRGVIARSIR